MKPLAFAVALPRPLKAGFSASDVAAVAAAVASSFTNCFPRSQPFFSVFPVSSGRAVSVVRWGLYAGFPE